MPVTASWYDEASHILCIDYVDHWTDDEFEGAVQAGLRLVKDIPVQQPVYVISDYLRSTRPVMRINPFMIASHVATHIYPRQGLIIVVTTQAPWRQMLPLLKPLLFGLPLAVVSTLEEALAEIAAVQPSASCVEDVSG